MGVINDFVEAGYVTCEEVKAIQKAWFEDVIKRLTDRGCNVTRINVADMLKAQRRQYNDTLSD